MTSELVGSESKAAVIVARDLCHRIVDGVYQEGDILPAEAELIASYGVSRSVLREALRLLEWDSYVVVRRGAGGGAVVMLPNVRVPARYCGLLLQVLGTTLGDLDQAIREIEPEIVRTIADEKPDALDVLDEALDAESSREHSASAFLTSGSHFHELLPAALGNPALKILLDIPRAIRVRHNLSVLTSLTEEPTYHTKTLATHRKTLHLMKEGNGEAARELWARHLAATSRALKVQEGPTVLDLFSGRTFDFDLATDPSEGRRRVRLPKGADIVASELRRLIVMGEIEEGQSVPTEGALMDHYGLSRPSVREALRVLEAEHLVQLVRGAHQGGRARRPNISTAIWQTGLLMQRLGCTVGHIAQAQAIVDRCASRVLTGPSGGSPVGHSVFEAVLQAGEGPGAPEGDLELTLDMFDSLNAHLPNKTLQALGTIGRTLLRRAVETSGLGEGDHERLWGPVRTQLSLLRAAGNRSLEQLGTAWVDGSTSIYRDIADSGIASQCIDMFR